ncbi:hypothetical protein DH2020_046719 [Rehmannia glutinosa]|uniref:Uncharacterized protein n=1 Tax=Rehmannia glutinosa TaxID=99300 RepID=A0ABR0UAU2_REHGL
MGFVVGWIMGFALGFGLIVGFARYQNTRSKRRTDLLNCLNHHIEKIWPYVDEAASEIIRNSVEPILEQYRPAILASLKFSKLTLGTVAPQFTGVSIIEGEPNEIVMELDMQWDGNPNIVLDIKTKVGLALPVQVKNIGFTGVFRLIFKPLVDEFPCFGAVCYSLREKRDLDFTLKVVGGDISSIPGISDALEVSYYVVPCYLEVKAVGILEVKLIEAKELTNKDIIGKSDPFAKIFIRPLRDRTKTSKTIDNQINPIWNEHFEFEVEDVSTQHLTVKIYDDEGVQAAELIGCAQIPLRNLEPGEVKDVWLKLVKDLDIQRDNKNRGQVHLELMYCPLSGESKFRNPFDPDFRLTSLEKALKQVTSDDGSADSSGPPKPNSSMKSDVVIVRGVLSVTVVSGEDLPVTDFMGKSDPFVVLTMKKSEQKNKTRVLNDTLNPVWNQTFDFVVEDGLHELLILEVYDHDTFGKDKMGRCIMTLTRAILEGEFTDTFNIEGAKSGKLTLHLKWTSQTIIKE